MQAQVRYIQIERIRPNLRLSYPEAVIEHMCSSIGSWDKFPPIAVFFDGEYFRIIDGEKRWRACKKMGWPYVEAVIEESYSSP
jgi:ParB family chromosome partitioning protein